MAYFYTFPTEVSLWTESGTRKGPICSQLVLSIKKTNEQTKQKKQQKIDEANYGNTCRSRDLEAQNKTPSTIKQGPHTYCGAVVLLKPVVF